MTRVHVSADGSKVNLDLNDVEDKFYLQAIEKFKQNINWLEFDEFAFGSGSPIYCNKRRSSEVIKEPLYRVLEDMWLKLGIQQGQVRQSR